MPPRFRTIVPLAVVILFLYLFFPSYPDADVQNVATPPVGGVAKGKPSKGDQSGTQPSSLDTSLAGESTAGTNELITQANFDKEADVLGL
jgi:hypothetical protein